MRGEKSLRDLALLKSIPMSTIFDSNPIPPILALMNLFYANYLRPYASFYQRIIKMNVTHAVNLFILYESRNQSNFSKTTSHIHSKFSHLHCHLTEVVNTFSLSFSLLPGLTPDINPVTTDDYCIGFRIVLNRLLKFQRFSLKISWLVECLLT